MDKRVYDCASTDNNTMGHQNLQNLNGLIDSYTNNYKEVNTIDKRKRPKPLRDVLNTQRHLMFQFDSTILNSETKRGYSH